ncbi:DotU family type IV/VI secretion system protein [Phycisphaeraceae bacterium D3-23]
MTPVELCDPLFRYICRLNRSVNAGVVPQLARVRSEVTTLLDQIADKARADQTLRDQFDEGQKGKLNQVLVYFVDSTIADSQCPFALEWPRIELDRYGEQVGDERFWIYLNECLEEGTPAAADRLAVYYQCIGLGFTGLYAGQPEYLRSKMADISRQIQKAYMSSDTKGTLCPEAYDHTDHSDLIEPPAPRMIGIMIAVLGLIITMFIANIYLYREARSDIANALETINAVETDRDDATAP